MRFLQHWRGVWEQEYDYSHRCSEHIQLLPAVNKNYHASNSRECMGVNGEALQLHEVYKKPYFLLQVMRESISVLQVT